MLGEGLSVGVGCRGQGLGGVTVPLGGLLPLQRCLCTRLQSRHFAPAAGLRRLPCWEELCPQGNCTPAHGRGGSVPLQNRSQK